MAGGARGSRGPRGYRYGRWSGGDDPLAPPYDVRAAVDALGDRVMEGRSVRDALRDVLREGVAGPDGERRRGLDELRARLARRREQLKRSGDLSGPLKEAREALEAALADERAALAAMDEAARAAEAGDTGEPGTPGAEAGDAPDGRRPDGGLPSEERVLREMTLDTLPRSTAGAVRELASYDWVSPSAKETYEQLLEDLRAQALRAQLGAGALPGQQGEAGEGGEGQGGQGAAGLKDLLADLNALLGKHAKGEDTSQDFADFMAKHGEAFPEQPKDVDELIDALAQRAAAMGRLMRSLSKEERREMASLMAQALGDADLAAEVSALGAHLQDLRPGAFGGRGERFSGGEPMSFDQGVAALGELSDLDALENSMEMGDPLSTLDDVDVDAVERQLGAGAAAQVEALRRLERELREQGWLSDSSEGLALSPKALRQLGQSALAKVFADLRGTGRGGHDDRSAGSAGEATGTFRAWSFGDEQPVDAVATVRRAVQRTAAQPPRGAGSQPRDPAARLSGTGRPPHLSLLPEDFAVVETERRASAAVALCVDLSWSMYAEGRWASMKQTALALAHLIATRYPQDALQVIGFGRTAHALTTAELAAVEPGHTQGTNLQHALALARRHVGRHPTSQPVVLVVTDGEPTAHLEPDGEAYFDWPTTPTTLRLTLTEVDAMTRARTPITTFVLGEDPGLRRFVDAIARRNGGRVMAPSPSRLGEYVVSDYLRARRGA